MLIEQLAKSSNLTASEAEKILNNLTSLIYQTLSEGGVVNWHGFGRFSVSHRKARLGVNPRTLKKITIPALRTPKYVAGEQIKRAVRK